jgi:glycosyltransferase involved in cell wall biosynthesis
MARIVRFESMARFEADRPADPRQRIAFVQAGSFSHTNELLLGMLRRNFENAEIDVIDAGQLLMREPFALLSCVAAVVLRYGPQVLLRKHARWRALFGTDLGFRAIRSRLRSRLGSGDYAFTFQTRSLFDASVPGIPHFVYTDHTARMKEQYGLGARELDARIATRWVGLEAAIYRNATCVFTQTDRAARSVIHDYGISADRVECLFGDTNVCRGDSFEEKSYDRKEILYVSGDRHGKGGEQLFEAFEIVRKKHPDASLTVVGPCPDLDLPGIDTVGMVQLAKLGEYYERATVFCLPTDREPLGYALLEAAENGLPIVSTRVGTMIELVVEGETGLLVAVGDVSGLAEALSTLLASAEMRRDLGRRGYEHIVQTYSWGGAERRLIARLLDSLATRAAT